jgi:hypothetical protein
MRCPSRGTTSCVVAAEIIGMTAEQAAEWLEVAPSIDGPIHRFQLSGRCGVRDKIELTVQAGRVTKAHGTRADSSAVTQCL